MTKEEAEKAIDLATQVMALERSPGWAAYIAASGVAAQQATISAAMADNQDAFRKHATACIAHNFARQWVETVLKNGQQALAMKEAALSRPTGTMARALDDRGAK